MSDRQILYKIIEAIVCPKCNTSTGIEFDNEGSYILCQDCDFEGHSSQWNREARVVDNG